MQLKSSAIFVILFTLTWANNCPNKKSTSKLFCYYGKSSQVDACKCTHVILPANSDAKLVDEVREKAKSVKILITVHELNQELVDLLKASKVDGIEVALKTLEAKNDLPDFISTIRTRLARDLYIALSVPSKGELLAKYYDFKNLAKSTDAFVLETAFLGASTNVTFHPSRLSGLWDMQNTDSVVDLVSGLGAPLSKVVIAAPVQAFRFRLQSEEYTAPGSPALEVQSLDREELCQLMKNGKEWTLERDQDQTGPYIFSGDAWIAFEDATSVDIKAKYARVRGLAGLALKDLSQDGGSKCDGTILDAAFNGLSKQARAPRGVVLHSLEREIVETSPRILDKVQVSPYRISRVIDVEGSVHVIRQDTRTEFECSRQGYFVHPRSCGRFYRCVKFDQLSDEFSVFEFDCPAGLAFDERVEVCVWPGSLPHASPCSGSSEIAPVPRQRFICPSDPGYYADPENCRWFFACLDHGKAPLSAYEFRCPFGLVYDEERLLCEWPWLVPRCGSGLAVGSEVVYGGSGLVALDQYNGLGVLGAVKLGGLQGPLQQPIARVYSNAGQSGLSLGAAQSLQNAGLLKSIGNLNSGATNYGQYTSSGNNINVGQYAGDNLNSGQYISSGNNLNFDQYTSTGNNLNNGQFASAGNNLNQAQYASNGDNLNYAQYASTGNNLNEAQYALNGDNLNYGQYASTGNNLNLNLAQYASNGNNQNYGQYASGGNNLNYAQYASNGNNLNYGQYASGGNNLNYAQYASIGDNLNYAQYASNSALNKINNQNQAQYATNSGAYAQNLQTNYENSDELLNLGGGTTGEANAYQINNLAYNSGSLHNQQALNNINIVGGGYSAGVEHGNVQINNNGENSYNQYSVTPSPISVSTVSSIPAVTAVPVPTLQVQSSFETYKGGVVANVPELQYRLENQGKSYVSAKNNFLSLVGGTQNGYNIGNEVNLQQNGVDAYQSPIVVASSPAPFTKPAVSYNIQQKEVLSSGYNYPKPSVAFEEGPAFTYSTPKTVVVQEQARILPTGAQPVSVSSIEGYDYPKPSIAFEEGPQVKVTSYNVPVNTIKPIYQQGVYVSSTPAPVVKVQQVQPVIKQQVVYQQPQVYVSSTPASVVHQPIVKQQVVYQQPQVYVSSTPASVLHQQVVHQQVIQPVHQQIAQPVQQQVHYEQPQVYVSSTPAPVIQEQGYQYPKPSISFEERPVVSYQKPIIQKPAVSTYNYQNVVQQAAGIGYTYPKPAIRFEETPVKYQQPTVVSSYNYLPVSTPKPAVLIQKQIYSAPVQQQVVVQKPIVTSYSYTPSTTAQPQVVVQNQAIHSYSYSTPIVQQPVVQIQKKASFEGYNYPKPSVTFEEQPQVYVSSTPAPVIRQQVVPVVKQQVYQQPQIVVQKPAVVSSYSYTPSTPQPQVYVQKQPISTYSYSTPVVQQKQQFVQVHEPIVQVQQPVVVQKPVVSSYTYTPSTTPQPQVYLQKQPVNTYSYSTPVVQQQQEIVQVQQPVVSSYSYTPTTRQPQVYVQKQPVNTYSYSTPVVQQQQQIVQVQQPVVVQKPAVVSSYSYTAPSTLKPDVFIQEIQKPAVQTYNYVTPTPKPVIVEKIGYNYPKPSVQFEEQPPVVYENRQPVEEVPFVAKKAYVTGGQSSSYYNQNTNFGAKIEQKPVFIQSYQTPVTSTPRYEPQGYIYEKPAVKFQEEARPVVVENYQAPELNVVKYQKVQQFLHEGYLPPSSPRPTLAAAVNTVIATKVRPQEPFYLYDTKLSTTPTPFVKIEAPIDVGTSRPIVRYSFSSLQQPTEEYLPVEPTREYLPVRQRVKVTTQAPALIEEVPVPTREYLPVRQRVKITTQTPVFIEEVPVPTREYLPVRQRVKVTTQTPVFIEEVPAPTREYLPIRQRVRVTTPAPLLIKEVPIPTREYLPVTSRVRYTSTTPESSEEYLVPEYTPVRQKVKVTTSEPVVVPTREYLPVRTKPRVKVTTEAYIESTTPSREYLPVRSRTRVTSTEPSREYLPVDEEVIVSTRRPVKVVKVVRPAKTIIKQNDFHPLLAAKLGAQCTCTSNAVKLRKRPIKIIVEEEEDEDEDDGYEVAPDNGVVVENYEYEPQRVNPTSEVIISSSPSPTRRLKVRPVSTRVYEAPVTQAVEVFIRKTTTEGPTDGEIVKAVRTGLKLVKQAAKEGAKEGTEEVLSKDFDRYGPGGVRSRNERLQGTVDCQRAGLFRHPNQCNKFYACRWDCKKNRFTLHVFNCPVHLTFDNSLGACNWPSQGPACAENTLLPSE